MTVLFLHTAPLHFMENKAHFVPLICSRKVQYVTGFTKTVLNRTFGNLRNIELKY